MIAANDLVRLPYTPDLTQSGIDYALRVLTHTRSWSDEPPFPQLRRTVARVALELAFRRHLRDKGIPFKVRSLSPYTDPDRYDISLGGHRCSVKSFLVSRRSDITASRRDPGRLLDAPALISAQEFAGESHGDQDLYVFAFLAGLLAASRRDMIRAREAGEPLCLVHVLPSGWAQPSHWHPLGIVLENEGDLPVEVEIGGQDAAREHLVERVALAPLESCELAPPFHSLAYLRAETLPRARVALHSRARNQTCLVPPVEWGNIWVYGMDIWLAGFITHDEFRRRANFVEQGARVFQHSTAPARCLAVPLADLRPLGELFERVSQSEKISG
jgi:hypothetical protein